MPTMTTIVALRGVKPWNEELRGVSPELRVNGSAKRTFLVRGWLGAAVLPRLRDSA